MKYSRAVVPEDAKDLNIELISAGDASSKMTCAACYVRFRLKNNQYSCQLILGKSKIVPVGMTLPRAELYAAVLNVHITEVVKRALKDKVVGQVLVTDSEIALHWLNSETKQLKPWTRNQVIEANRFSVPEDRYHIDSESNPADIGTRKGVTIQDIAPGSEWESGKSWMKLPLAILRESHLKNVKEIKYKKEQLVEIEKESIGSSTNLCDSGFSVMTQPIKPAGFECFLVDKKTDL